MKRAGFTMIELIFVIVILGILASVAVPKLIGVKDSADEGLVKGFVGTLNRTVGPSKWSQSLMDGLEGSINTGATYDIDTDDTEFPSSFSTAASGTGLDLSNCVDENETAATAAVATNNDGDLYIVCRDGSASQAPKFWYTTVVTTDFNDSKLKL